MKRTAALLFLIWLFVGVGHAQPRGTADLRPTVILVSFDGWRWDYATKFYAPNLQKLATRGVRAENLIPSFPSKTFPNHYTIVTGLYPGHHGIVANNIKDPGTGRRFAMSIRREVQDPMWWGGEPIWVTAQRAGQASGAMFWPGSEAPILGLLPTFWSVFDDTIPGARRVEQILRWLDLPAATRPTFMTLYFSDVDTAGHDFGPDASAVAAAVRRVDGYLGQLLSGLERRRMLDGVNVVVTSDHGMSETSNRRVVVLDDYISLNDVEIIDLNPTLGLYPKTGLEDRVYTALVAAHPSLKVFRRADTPARWHYRDHPRIPPIVGVVDEGWQLLERSTLVQRMARELLAKRGEHGYDPHDAMSMRGIFVASGPAFRQGVTVPAFENVHIYSALAQVLGLTPAMNDGDPAVGRTLLR